jgi:cytochrome d ubiquinol oxidase subunit I
MAFFFVRASFYRMQFPRWSLYAAVAIIPTPWIAAELGWFVAEFGRQPWTVYELLRTADSLSPIDAPAVAVSMASFAVVYFFVFGAGVFYLLRLMSKPPESDEDALSSGPLRSAGVHPAARAAGSAAGE